MALVAADESGDQPNNPLAPRMALIASLTFNVVVGSIFGSPGVLLKPMSEHLGVGAELISGASVAVILSSAIFAPQFGALAMRVSLRKLLQLAAACMIAAWLLLAFTKSYVVYLGAYFLLLGPAMALGASILPPTLVTRWFNRNRGLAIGLVHLPIVVAAMPLGAQWVITHYGLQATFLMLAALPALILLPASLFLVDRPPEQAARVAEMKASGETFALSIWQILARPRFWALCMAAGVANTSSTMLGVHLVSMAESWGIERMSAAGLASIMSLVGMAGTVLVGILADRIGGARCLAVIAAGDALLWAMFLLGLPYLGLAAVIGLIGLLGAGTVPAMVKALGDAFGRESFSRAIGLMVPVTLPLMFVGLIGPATVARLTGSYTLVVLAMIVAFALAALFALAARGPSRSEPTLNPA